MFDRYVLDEKPPSPLARFQNQVIKIE